MTPSDKPPPPSNDDATDAQSQAEIERLERLAKERGLDKPSPSSGEKRTRPLAPVRPAPESEIKEFVVASPMKRERDTIKLEHKVEIKPELLHQPDDIDHVAEEAGIDRREFKKLRRAKSRAAETALALHLDPKVREKITAKGLGPPAALPAEPEPTAPQERTVGGNTVRLESPVQPEPLPPPRGDVDLGDFDPAKKTVGGRTVKGLPKPEGLRRDEDTAPIPTDTDGSLPPDSSGAFAAQQPPQPARSRVGLLLFALIAFIGGGIAVIASLDLTNSRTEPSAPRVPSERRTAAPLPTVSAAPTTEEQPSPSATSSLPVPWRPSTPSTHAPSASAPPSAAPPPAPPASSGRPDIPFD
jgi:hypothetical protein